jgi:hypothetical protein
MKIIILFFALTVCILGYSQKYCPKKEVLSIDAISITYAKQKLYIDLKNSDPIHFQIWKKNDMILDAKGSAKGKESFSILKGKYKLIIFNEHGKPKTKIFPI